MRLLVAARIQWGKWFPLESRDVEQMYPHVETFRNICREMDPQGVFQNEFTERMVFNGHREES